MTENESPAPSPASAHILVTVLRLVLDGFRNALPLPNPDSSEQVREWLQRLSPTLYRLAGRTVTAFDDAAASLFGRIVDSDELWEAVWTVFLHRASPMDDLMGGEEGLLAEACAAADGNSGSTDPAVVLALIDAAVDLVQAMGPQVETHPVAPPPPPPAEAATDVETPEAEAPSEEPTEEAPADS